MPVLDSRILAFQVSNRLTDAPTGTRIELMCRMAQCFKPDVSAEECIEAILAVDTDLRMLAEPCEHLPVARKWWAETVEHKPNPEVWEGDAMWEAPVTHTVELIAAQAMADEHNKTMDAYNQVMADCGLPQLRHRPRYAGKIFEDGTFWSDGPMKENPCCLIDLLPSTQEAFKAPPVCSHCNDTHKMELHDATVMCTHCPIPCRKCQVGGNGPYCTTTPCGCECHGHKTDLRNERGVPIAGDRLSRDSDLDFPKRDR